MCRRVTKSTSRGGRRRSTLRARVSRSSLGEQNVSAIKPAEKQSSTVRWAATAGSALDIHVRQYSGATTITR